MSEWTRILANPLSVAGFTLFLVCAGIAMRTRNAGRRWLSPTLFSLAFIALVGGLASSYWLSLEAGAPQPPSANVPVISAEQTEAYVRLQGSGGGSPNVRGAGDNVAITADQSGSKTELGKTAEKPQQPVGSTAIPQRRFETVKVYYGTDRAGAVDKLKGVSFGPNRSMDGALSLGYCDVAVPYDRETGSLHRRSLLRYLHPDDPEYWITVVQVSPLSRADFLADISKGVTSASHLKNIFVFIHGYNVSFSDAAARTAQLAYDLQFDGVPIFYSWPSKAEWTKYTADENEVDWTVPHLEQFLSVVASQTNADQIFLIAHSMGNRALVRALEKMTAANGGNLNPKFRHLVLAAPDIDADVFGQLAGAMKGSATDVTLYASRNDLALEASKLFHFAGRRAGDTSAGLFTYPGITSIDASEADTALGLGHSYFASTDSIVGDLYYLIRGIPPNGRRRLHLTSNSSAWYLVP